METKVVKRVVEATLLATNPRGPRTWKRIVKIFIFSRLIKFLHNVRIPLEFRQAVMFKALEIYRMKSFVYGGSKGDTFENDLLKLIFNATAIANIADNAASSPLTDLYVGLHTSDPGETGDETTNEISYTGYARVAVARTSGGWTVSTNTVVPAAAITFGEMSGGAGGTVTHGHIGTDSSGTGKILYSGTVSPNISVVTGVTPSLKTTSSITED